MSPKRKPESAKEGESSRPKVLSRVRAQQQGPMAVSDSAIHGVIRDMHSRLVNIEAENRRLKSLLAPLIRGQLEPTASQHLEHPDLSATVEDLNIVCLWMNEKTHQYSNFAEFLDMAAFLNSFAQQPPVLRLVLCAIAALFVAPEKGNWFFTRARKAVERRDPTPSLQTVQGFYLMYVYGMLKGQPQLSRVFLKQATDLVKEMRLDVDPDDSPWLYALNLAPRAKEERRRTFWRIVYSCEHELAMGNPFYFPELSGRVNYSSQIMDPFLIFADMRRRELAHPIFQTLVKLRRHFWSPPETARDLVESSVWQELKCQFLSVRKALPQDALLYSDSPLFISLEEEKDFIPRLAALPDFGIAYPNFMLLASCSLLHRPIIFLTALPSFHPLLMTQSQKPFISEAVRNSWNSAHRIASLVSLITKQSSLDAFSTSLIYAASAAVFESIATLWLITCRMHPSWREILGLEPCSDAMMNEKVETMIRVIDHKMKLEETNTSNSGTLLVTIKAMANEIRVVLERGGKHVVDHSGLVGTEADDATTEHLVLGMQIVSLGTEQSESPTSTAGVLPTLKEPETLLGLLGQEIFGGLRWMGRHEEQWRFFYKINA